MHDNLSKYGDTAHHHATLEEIHRKLQQHGIHTARAYPQRARQFMPFAALKGYHELAHSKELIPQEKPTLAEDESSQLDSMLIRTKKGNALRVRYYHEGHLLVTEGIVKEIDLVFHTLYIKHTAIKFDDIVSLEELFEGPTQQCGQDEP